MPTKRAGTFFVLALVIYFLANQTQVGWLYIITAGLAGLLITAWLYTRGVFKAVKVQRTLQPAEIKPNARRELPAEMTGREEGEPELALPNFYEDDPIEITLHLVTTSLKPALLVKGTEFCPFAPAPEQTQPFFVPGLFKNRSVSLSYQTYCDRRGLYTFPPIKLHSRGGLGLFQTQRTFAAPSEILIYPHYHPLQRLRLLERQEFMERQATRAGAGSQVLGTREYRTGDSLRQIHWRSTARLGRLVVKEFTEDKQATLTVIMDLSAGGSRGQGKFSTFETAVRIAASLAYYADYKHLPFYLVGAGPANSQAASRRWALPAVPLGWWTTLNYLARVKNNGGRSLATVLNEFPGNWPGLLTSTFLVILVSNPDEVIPQALLALSQKGGYGLAILITSEETPPALIPKMTGLEVKSVTPYNWAAVLAG